MKKLLIILLLFIGLNSAQATESQSTSFPEAVKIQMLLEQIAKLQAQLEQLRPKKIPQFQNNLYLGLKQKPEVKLLQDFLIKKELLEIGGNSGDFSVPTKIALQKYQRLNGISPASGFFGPKTRDFVNKQIIKEAIIQNRIVTSLIDQTRYQQNQAASIFQVRPKPNWLLESLGSKIFTAINEVRQKNGLGMLTWSDPTAQTARLHSEDQAEDNLEITDPDAICTFPLIRHEGFKSGFDAGERLQNRNISFRRAAENILIMPVSKNLIFRYSQEEKIEDCPELPKPIIPKEASREEKTKILNQTLEERKEAIKKTKKVQWANKEWFEEKDIITRAVESWMNSEGHRANILTPEYTQSGIGIASVNDYLITTQIFIRD